MGESTGKAKITKYSREEVAGSLSSGFSNCVLWSPRVPQSTLKATLGNNGRLSGLGPGLYIHSKHSSQIAPFSMKNNAPRLEAPLNIY